MKKIVTGILSLLVWGMVYNETIEASELNFSVEAVLPENQREGSTYFDLLVQPSTTQEIVAKIKNHSNEEIKVATFIEPATTNINGVVDYGVTDTTTDETAPLQFKEVVTSKEETVTIPAMQTVDYKITIKLPDKTFDGVVAGGLTFREQEDEKDEEKDNQQGMAIENKFAYSIALLLRQTETTLASDLKLLKVEPSQVNARNVINSYLQNPVAKYLNKFNVTAKVTEKDKSETLYETKNEGMQMAPNTTMAYPLRLEGEKLKAGMYTMHIEASSGEDQWTFEQDFEITAEKARELNKTDVSIEENNDQWLIYIGIGILALLLMIIIFLLIKKKK
ncbi:DUF916 and DUF3324 domain-containing protein [Vagococcus zengguangii]|uniref:DUF916 and DUF3324 domain-containing protein n=1 Tax=Vagococcus zengguangii TaxID=2571750 RepID=UPI001107AB23|nr:DUF916 and DUF3324 domain-containing protein [Vagococcus zengguangii]TLG78274.1 DUF916 and DUF3324 domain-containing protein [Vagococcus zengguangii]